MRKLATIRKIEEVKSIPDADKICAYRVDGWWIVDTVDRYRVGDLTVYFEIDSWMPHELAPFLSKGSEPREYNGVKGQRLRTVKLRGQVSQGLLIPISAVYGKTGPIDIQEGRDITDLLGIQKWEAPIPAQLAGQVRGMFPTFIPKTDQERVQNLRVNLDQWIAENTAWEVTEKLDGSSMTVYVKDDDSGVCSRNLNLKQTDDNTLWAVAVREQLIEKIKQTGRNLALQGELIGEGVQGNPYRLKGQNFFLFDIFDIDRQEYLRPKERRDFAKDCNINHVPVIAYSAKLLDTLGLKNIDDVLFFAEGKSVMGLIGCEREGLVFKSSDQAVSFKAISNRFLLKEK